MTDQEINEVVARKRGWTQEEHYKFLPPGVRCRCISGRHWYRKGPGILPNYVRDIEAAWEIVDRVSKTNVIRVLGGFGGSWSCDIGNHAGAQSRVVVSESADTAPLAICLAFLKLP